MRGRMPEATLRSGSHTREDVADESFHLTLIDQRSRSSLASGPSGPEP